MQSLMPRFHGRIGSRGKVIFASTFSPITSVQISAQKYFSFAFSEFDVNYRCPALDQEGRFAIVTNVGCGMRWTRRCCSVIPHVDEQHHAYGEIVWSWHPGADAKSGVALTHHSDDGGKKAGLRGERV
jgi:hypothetical protein